MIIFISSIIYYLITMAIVNELSGDFTWAANIWFQYNLQAVKKYNKGYILKEQNYMMKFLISVTYYIIIMAILSEQ